CFITRRRSPGPRLLRRCRLTYFSCIEPRRGSITVGLDRARRLRVRVAGAEVDRQCVDVVRADDYSPRSLHVPPACCQPVYLPQSLSSSNPLQLSRQFIRSTFHNQTQNHSYPIHTQIHWYFIHSSNRSYPKP